MLVIVCNSVFIWMRCVCLSVYNMYVRLSPGTWRPTTQKQFPLYLRGARDLIILLYWMLPLTLNATWRPHVSYINEFNIQLLLWFLLSVAFELINKHQSQIIKPNNIIYNLSLVTDIIAVYLINLIIIKNYCFFLA